MPVDPSATVSGLDALKERLREAARATVADGLAIVTAAAMTNAPVRTGTLRRSIYMTPVQDDGPDRFSGRTGPTVIYARIRELGGDIYPKRAQFLRWMGPTGPIYARHVHQVGRPYLKPAVESSREQIADAARRRASEAIRGG